MNLATFLERLARADPGRTGVFLGAAPWKDWGRLAADAAGLARGFRERLGLAPGDRVALVMTNAPEYAEVLLAAWWAGLAAVPVNAKLHPREVAYILGHSGARAVFATPEWMQAIAQAVADLAPAPFVVEAGSADYRALVAEPIPVTEVDENALAWLFYTSGTTGRPKGAMLSHANLRAMGHGYLDDVDTVTPAHCLLHAAPMSHGSGLYLVPYLMAGAAQVIPESGGFDAAAMR